MKGFAQKHVYIKLNRDFDVMRFVWFALLTALPERKGPRNADCVNLSRKRAKVKPENDYISTVSSVPHQLNTSPMCRHNAKKQRNC